MSHEDWSVDVGRVSVREAVKPGEGSSVKVQVFHGAPESRTEQQAHVREKLSANVDLNQERTF